MRLDVRGRESAAGSAAVRSGTCRLCKEPLLQRCCEPCSPSHYPRPGWDDLERCRFMEQHWWSTEY